MANRTLLAVLPMMGLLAALALATTATAAAPCPSGSVHGHLDYAADVENTAPDPWVEEAGHADVDVLEIRSCVEGTNIVLGLRVDGSIVTDDPDTSYEFFLRGPDLMGYNLWYENGTATYLNDDFDEVPVNFTVDNDWLAILLPQAEYGNASSGWTLKADARADPDGNGISNLIDSANLDLTDEFDASFDITLESTSFNSPKVTITSVTVTAAGSGFTVVVDGTTQGPVDELRVAMATQYKYSTTVLDTSFSGTYYREGSGGSGSSSWSLAKVGGSWASWKFTRNYTQSELLGMFASLYTVNAAKLEVRAVNGDGKWGHANSTFQPVTVSQAPGSGNPGGAGGSSTMLILVLVAVVAAGAVAGVLVMRKRKKAGAPPPATPVSGPPPGNPPK